MTPKNFFEFAKKHNAKTVDLKFVDPGEPLDRDIYKMTSEEPGQYRKTPGSLAEAVDALPFFSTAVSNPDRFNDIGIGLIEN